jgi:hypothetical protein
MMRRRPAQTLGIAQDDAAAVAEFLRQDFTALVAIFDRQLMNGAAPGAKHGPKIPVARAAAERGVRLAEELVALLRAPTSQGFRQ